MPESSESQSSEPNILRAALAIVYGPRAKEYGHPRNNFRRIALLWQAWLEAKYPSADLEIDELDVGVMMTQVKQARLLESPLHRDTHVDIAGYAEATSRALGLDK